LSARASASGVSAEGCAFRTTPEESHVVEAGLQDEDAVANDEVTGRCSSLIRRDQAPASMWRSGSGLPMRQPHRARGRVRRAVQTCCCSHRAPPLLVRVLVPIPIGEPHGRGSWPTNPRQRRSATHHVPSWPPPPKPAATRPVPTTSCTRQHRGWQASSAPTSSRSPAATWPTSPTPRRWPSPCARCCDSSASHPPRRNRDGRR
jgi:hypothetical protein